MTFGNIGLPLQSARWYGIGCAAAIPDFCLKCIYLNLWLFRLKVPHVIPFSLAAYAAGYFLAKQREVAVRATFLGVITALGIQIVISGHSSYKGLGMYIVFLSWFHFSEYFFTEKFNPEKAKLSSFMLDHSCAYKIALTCSIIEFLVERYLYPGWKEYQYIIIIGSVICVFGEYIRKRAMYVAGPNFNHHVQRDLKEPHTLVTHDIYSYIQHPSYTGWFIFTIGTQVTLCNPFCALAFPYVMYKFFEDRVKQEEPALLKKYEEKYEQYQKCTPRFIPYLW